MRGDGLETTMAPQQSQTMHFRSAHPVLQHTGSHSIHTHAVYSPFAGTQQTEEAFMP